MPVHKTKDGGYQWGNSGKVYYGKDAKKKAEAQGQAVLASGYKENKKRRK
jgi:hypothetical protein